MEALAARLTRFFLQNNYIEPEQAAWLQYGLTRRLMGLATFVLLLPVGAFLVGWPGAFLYVFTFRFLRTRTGGYHAATPHGCLLSSLCSMVAALTLARAVSSRLVCAGLLFGAALLIALLAPANNAALHLSEEEIAAIRPRALARLAVVVLAGCALLCGSVMLANCVAVSLLAVAALLVFSNLGLGTQ